MNIRKLHWYAELLLRWHLLTLGLSIRMFFGESLKAKVEGGGTASRQ